MLRKIEQIFKLKVFQPSNCSLMEKLLTMMGEEMLIVLLILSSKLFEKYFFYNQRLLMKELAKKGALEEVIAIINLVMAQVIRKM